MLPAVTAAQLQVERTGRKHRATNVICSGPPFTKTLAPLDLVAKAKNYMSLESKYQPNREVLERFVEFVKREGTTRTDRIVPTVEQLGQIVETVFWASLLEEEGHQVYPALLP